MMAGHAGGGSAQPLPAPVTFNVKEEEEWTTKGLEPVMQIVSYLPAVFAIVLLSLVNMGTGVDNFTHGLASLLLLSYGYIIAPVLLGTNIEHLKIVMVVRIVLASCSLLVGVMIGAAGDINKMFVYIAWAVFAFAEVYLIRGYVSTLQGYYEYYEEPPVQQEPQVRVVPIPMQTGNDFGLDSFGVRMQGHPQPQGQMMVEMTGMGQPMQVAGRDFGMDAGHMQAGAFNAGAAVVQVQMQPVHMQQVQMQPVPMQQVQMQPVQRMQPRGMVGDFGV